MDLRNLMSFNGLNEVQKPGSIKSHEVVKNGQNLVGSIKRHEYPKLPSLAHMFCNLEVFLHSHMQPHPLHKLQIILDLKGNLSFCCLPLVILVKRVVT